MLTQAIRSDLGAILGDEILEYNLMTKYSRKG
jgi:hypothetical protein